MNTTSGQFFAAPPRFPPCKWRQFLLSTVVYIPENHPLVNETNPLHSNHSRQPSLSQPISPNPTHLNLLETVFPNHSYLAVTIFLIHLIFYFLHLFHTHHTILSYQLFLSQPCKCQPQSERL
jgi:hypothetical protein